MNNVSTHNIFDYYNDKLCVYANWLTDNNRIISKSNYKYLLHTKKELKSERTARGLGNYALISYDSIPERFKLRIKEFLGGNPYDLYKGHWFERYLAPSAEINEFFAQYTYGDNAKTLPHSYQKTLQTQAMFMNAIHVVKKEKRGMKRLIPMSGGEKFIFWERMSEIVNGFAVKYAHKLPAKHGSLRNKYDKFRKGGPVTLISGKYGKKNAQKVTADMERLLMGLFMGDSKPYKYWVVKWYKRFLQGKETMFDAKTAEIFNPEDFAYVSDATIINLFNTIDNKITAERKRNDRLYYDSKHRPHKMYHEPQYSLSLLSLDDSDSQATLTDGKHPKRYIAYDRKAGAVVGWAVSRDKNSDLFFDMLYNMFRNLHAWNLGMPMEIQVEHHLVSQHKEKLEKLFPYVTFANPGVAREKYAEPMNRVLKYGFEKLEHQVGRHYAKNETNRMKEKKYWDENGMQSKEYKYGMKEYRKLFAKIVAKFNKALHHNQKEHTGLSRLDVLLQNANPEIQKLPRHTICRQIGHPVKTSIRFNQYVVANKVNYWLESPELLKYLEPNNYKVTAYYLPELDGTTDEVFLYQNDKYIGRATDMPTINPAKAERTEDDAKAEAKQEEYLEAFYKQEKEKRESIPKVGRFSNKVVVEQENKNADIIKVPKVKEKSFEDILAEAEADAEFAEVQAEYDL